MFSVGRLGCIAHELYYNRLQYFEEVIRVLFQNIFMNQKKIKI